jgi:hypothetical protein
MQEVSRKVINMPSFIRVKKSHSYRAMVEHNLSPFFYYTASRKGWDMTQGGLEMYYIAELKKWVPSKHFNVVTSANPN